MKEVYMRPNLEIISFEPQKAIAAGWSPDWGYEETFSVTRPAPPKLVGLKKRRAIE